MATEAQIAANRANALKSTGPTSPLGKAASSQNARKHGLAGTTTAALMDSETDRALVESRKALLRDSYRPETPEDEEHLDTLVAESIRVERARDAYFALCRDHGRRARLCWDADRRREADELALRLAKAPHAVARKLEETRQGAELKLDLWRALGATLEAHRDWTDDQRRLALDLLGIRPELRDAETPADPREGDVLEARRALVASETARIEELLADALAELDESDREMAEATLGAELTRPVQLMHRYEHAASNRLARARRHLEEARKAREARAEALPKPAAAPLPSRPDPATRAHRVEVLPVSAGVARPVAVEPPAPRFDAPEPTHPLNRHERRAQVALARRAGG